MSLDGKIDPGRTEKLLLKKKGMLGQQRNSNVIRNAIKNKEEEEFKQSKPFFKKYGSQKNTTKTGKQTVAQLRVSQSSQLKGEKQQVTKAINEPINTMKQSFSQKLRSNIIKDESSPSPNSKNSFRIKKIQSKSISPKKARDDLIALNEQEYKLQRQILQMHKTSKPEIDRIFQIYKLQAKKITDFMPQKTSTENNEVNLQESQHLQKAYEKLNHLLKHKAKQLAKHKQKIIQNPYIHFLHNMPQDIEEIDQSEEEDLVEELPQDRPKLEAGCGSYSIAMANIKNKNYSLNLRRTYDVFQDVQKQDILLYPTQPSKSLDIQQQVKQSGDNRVTLNHKFKDFLLS